VTRSIEIPVLTAPSRAARLRGLLGRWRLPAGHGLLLRPCRAVHTLGMTRPIDVVFVARDGRVVDLRRGLGWGRIAYCRRAAAVIELAAGDAWRLGLWRGCRVACVERGPAP
jgi:uncharacterized membrane protein (UPF0127 family)